MRFSSVCVYAPISSYYKNKNHIGLESIAMISFNFNYFFKDPIYKHSLVLKYWGLGLQHISFRKRHNQSLPEFKKKKKNFFFSVQNVLLIFLMKHIYDTTYTYTLNFNIIFLGYEFSKVNERSWWWWVER